MARRVLLVDDDPRVLASTAELLRELGHEAIEIGSADQALVFLQAERRAGFGHPRLRDAGDERPQAGGEDPGTAPHTAAAARDGIADGAAGTSLPRLDKPFSLIDLARQIEAVVAAQSPR